MNKYSRPLAVLAFSGGLDTTFCALWLREELGFDVVTVTVDTGGLGPRETAALERRSREAGAAQHRVLDGREELYRRFVAYLIKGNVLRGRVYPLCVAAERFVQAERVARLGLELGAKALAHGSTGAGNDQFRFDAAFHALAPGLEVLAPVRQLGWPRAKEAEYLSSRGVSVDSKTAAYSVNAGLWGTTVGGRETHDPWAEIPDAVFARGPDAAARPPRPRGSKAREAPGNSGSRLPPSAVLGFEKGLPVSLDGAALPGIEIVSRLERLGRAWGAGRGIHIGETVAGIKGRVAFEAPGALMLISAHRELEKLVLTRWQQFWKDHLADFYGQLLHEGLALDPVMRDIEALIDSSQAAVSGEARLRLSQGRFEVTGVRSPNSLMDPRALYGEESRLWTGADAAAYARLRALPMALAHRAQGSPSGGIR